MIPARSAGANPVRTASASWGEVSQVDVGHAHAAAQHRGDLVGQRVQDAGASLQAAAELAGLLRDPGLGDHERDERLGAHRGAGQGGGEFVVHPAGQFGAVGTPMRRDPLLPFGAVVGDGADQEHDVADQGRPGGHVEQFGEAASVLVAAVALGHADAGVPDRGGHRPRAQAVVLDDRVPGLRRALRGSVVDLDAGHHPGQVRVLEGFGLPGGGLAAPRRPAERLPDGEAEAGEQPAGGRSAADGDDDQHRHHGCDRGELGREQPALLVGGHEHGDDREGQGRQPGAGQARRRSRPGPGRSRRTPQP